MRKNTPTLLLAGAILSMVPLWSVNQCFAQTRGAERKFHEQKSEVEKAIHELQPTLKGRLPIFDGFVENAAGLSERYTRGYYECTVLAVAEGREDTKVSVTAKITAWYTDPNPVQSGYRVLLSNGRLEADLLDRIEETVAPRGAVLNGPQSPQPGISSPDLSTYSKASPFSRVSPGTSTLPAIDRFPAVRGGLGAGSPGPSLSPAEGITAVGTTSEDIESLRRRREEAEKRLNNIKSDVQNLEEILANQTHPADIAVVRKSGTRVLSKPAVTASVLFSADAEDEFQVLDSTADWVRVQISGASRGWIRRADLNLPALLDSNSKQAAASAAADAPPFRVVREETNPFQGAWQPLKGKTVMIIWAEPSAASVKPASSEVRRDFAKSLLIKVYQEISSHDQAVAGVVIVFDSADGGQVAATFDDLKQWQTGTLSEASFWRLCSVDPPELFQAVSSAHDRGKFANSEIACAKG